MLSFWIGQIFLLLLFKPIFVSFDEVEWHPVLEPYRNSTASTCLRGLFVFSSKSCYFNNSFSNDSCHSCKYFVDTVECLFKCLAKRICFIFYCCMSASRNQWIFGSLFAAYWLDSFDLFWFSSQQYSQFYFYLLSLQRKIMFEVVRNAYESILFFLQDTAFLVEVDFAVP